MADTETRAGGAGRPWVVRHPLVTIWAVVILGLAVALVVATKQGSARRAEAAEACRVEVASRYVDPGDEATVLVTYVAGRDRLEFSAVDTLARFHWTCMATETSDGWSVSVWK